MTDTPSITVPNAPATTRLLSLDVFRGLIMCTLAINGFAFATTAKRVTSGAVAADSISETFWEILAFHNSHPPWNSQFYVLGYSYWDMIQPAFMFMVGVAMPYSYASRRRRGDSEFKLTWHALVRSIVLILIGVFLQTKNSGLSTNALLTNVLSQIGLGYCFVYLAMKLSTKAQIVVAAIVLLTYMTWLNIYPIPAPISETSVRSIQSLSVFPNVAPHFAIETNGAAAVDVSFLRLLLGDETIQPHHGGYATLNFIPSAVTMLIGAIAGSLLRSPVGSLEKIKRLVLSGAICLAIAVMLSFTWCPVVKRIWTPSWTLFSGAYVLWTLAILYWLVDVAGYRRWTFPFVVVGTNSLAMYLMSMLWKRWIAERMEVFWGKDLFTGTYGPTIQAVSVFAVLWLFCFYLYRNKLFFRI
ncbi:MAG: DUF5009 domain-containing protein [Planctomycetales bacterium]|nr:DUF5009 domain-containing protein [Planctomycetales bacterium]